MKVRWCTAALGVVVVVGIASCGGAKQAAAPTMAPSDNGATRRGEIERLDARITSELEALKLARPPTQPHPLGTAVNVRPTSDANCKPAQVPACGDTCKLSDSICDAAKRICDIADELADEWARDKCASATTACSAARDRCCNCTL